MKRLIPVAVLIATIASTPALAAPARSVTFRLDVQGPVQQGTTFWVAWGPLGGRFGIAQLVRHGGVWTASRALPAGRTTFAYLEGNGTVHTRAGLAPGAPVITIQRLNRPASTSGNLPVVHWSAPVG